MVLPNRRDTLLTFCIIPPDSGVVGLSVGMHVVPIPGVAFSDCVVLGDDLADGEVDGAPVVPSYLLN